MYPYLRLQSPLIARHATNTTASGSISTQNPCILWLFTTTNKERTIYRLSPSEGSEAWVNQRRAATTNPDKRSAWLRKLDEECPYQVVLPRRQSFDDSEIMDFLIHHVGNFDMYVEDDYAAFVRYCFEDPMDAEIFRARFEPKDERFPARRLRRLLIINHAGSAPKGGHRRLVRRVLFAVNEQSTPQQK